MGQKTGKKSRDTEKDSMGKEAVHPDTRIRVGESMGEKVFEAREKQTKRQKTKGQKTRQEKVYRNSACCVPLKVI